MRPIFAMMVALMFAGGAAAAARADEFDDLTQRGRRVVHDIDRDFHRDLRKSRHDAIHPVQPVTGIQGLTEFYPLKCKTYECDRPGWFEYHDTPWVWSRQQH